MGTFRNNVEENDFPSLEEITLEEINEVLDEYLKSLADPICEHCDGTGTIAYICPCTNAPGHLGFAIAEKIYKLINGKKP